MFTASGVRAIVARGGIPDGADFVAYQAAGASAAAALILREAEREAAHA
jgi:hypothetical protein